MKRELIEWCERNSLPLTTFNHLCMLPEKFSRGKKINIKKAAFLEHLDEMAEPFPDFSVKHNRSASEIDHVKKSALKYKATKRVLSLSEPVDRKNPTYRNFLKITRAALKHNASSREENLAKPTKRRNPRPRDFTKVSKSAREHEASERTQNLTSEKTSSLAKPRERKDKVTKKHPFEVSKAALTCEASERTANLGKPKCVTPKYKNPEDKWKHRFDRDTEEEEKQKQTNEKKKNDKNNKKKNKENNKQNNKGAMRKTGLYNQ
ncbi:histone-lysine N-methyltransferase, H3 lysine-79 specific-like [Atheta coriaria]|uniref:histone-lysine N-methyltransferase, H3 lysine-79 specific-like n=1 Tax=Dalotia coriaria TaxID=877792 RepID=UPI0031F3766C